MTNKEQPAPRYSFWRMCGDFLSGLQAAGQHGMSLIAFLAILAVIAFAVAACSFGISTSHVPTFAPLIALGHSLNRDRQ